MASRIRYKPGLISDFARALCAGRPEPGTDRKHCQTFWQEKLQGQSYGRSEKKNIAVAAWHASFG
jgi:hypothetical protein